MTQPTVPMAILAGGLATRLRPLTETIPKSLVAVGGEPFIGHQLRLLRSAGLTRVVICAGYLGEMIQQYVGDGNNFGLEVEYSFDGGCRSRLPNGTHAAPSPPRQGGPTLLGTAGALRAARHLLGDCFQVMYGDSYLTCDYLAVQAAFDRAGRQALMTIYHNEGQYDSSNVEYAAGEIVAYDKKHRTPRMSYIDYGLGVLRASALDAVPQDQPFSLADLYADLLSQGQLAAYEVADRFYEIGSMAGLEETRQFLAGGGKQTALGAQQ